MAPRLDTVDIRLLRVFVAVAEARSFAAAQTVLNVGASTISNHIAALETRLGVKLCHRGRAGFKLTEDGEVIFGETQKLFAAIDGFDLRASALRSRVKGKLAIGVVDNTISDRTAPLHQAIAAFVAAMPDVQIVMDSRPPNELLRELMEGRLNVVIGSFPKILLGLTYIKLYDEPHRFYCGRTHPLYGSRPHEVTHDRIAQHRIVSRGYWGTRPTRHARSDKATAVVNNMEAEARLILSGAYLGYLPVHYAAQWVARGEMRLLIADDLGFDAPFEIAYAHAADSLRPVRLFIKSVLAQFAIEPPTA